VTLCLHLIRPDASGMDAIVTLCVQCSDLAIDNGLESDVIPHFLRHLWCHLHHSEKALGPPPNLSGRWPMRSSFERSIDPAITRPAWKTKNALDCTQKINLDKDLHPENRTG
jgi:hypothetical protein